LSDAISISGYIPTSGDITISTIEKLDIKNMGIAVGILFIGATELELHVGDNFTPPRWPSKGVKKILDNGGLSQSLPPAGARCGLDL